MKESDIGYDDIVAMTTTDQEAIEDVNLDEHNEFDQFESWVMGLGEESAITSQDPEEQQTAKQELQELVSQAFPTGVDGSNAIESLKGIIEDPQLFKAIKEQAQQDPDTDVRGMVKDWLESNAPEALEELDFGDYQEEPAAGEEPQAAAEEPAPEEVPQESDQHNEKQSRSMDIQELAEFIHTFYDPESGTFPKSPEGVAIMVGKKFGPQAEQVARKMVERMAPQQTSPEVSELARIKELARW
jgi:hypothetical protein